MSDGPKAVDPRPPPHLGPVGHTHPHSRLSRLIWSATTLSCSWYSGPPAVLLALPLRAAMSRTCWTKTSVKRRLCRISVCSCCADVGQLRQWLWLHPCCPGTCCTWWGGRYRGGGSAHLHQCLLREVRGLEGHSSLQVGGHGVSKATAVARGRDLRGSLTTGSRCQVPGRGGAR